MSDIAFIGDRDTVWVFQALGTEVFFSDECDSVPKLVANVLRGEFKIIFVTEDVYDSAREGIDTLQEQAIPTFAVIPSVKGSRGTATQIIRESVRRATGAEFI
jgi:V/A-type H+-transporting ATPase subunit F